MEKRIVTNDLSALKKLLGEDNFRRLNISYNVLNLSPGMTESSSQFFIYINTESKQNKNLEEDCETIKHWLSLDLPLVILNQQSSASTDHIKKLEEVISKSNRRSFLGCIYLDEIFNNFSNAPKNGEQNLFGLLGCALDSYFLKRELNNYSMALNQVLASTLEELHRAKAIHERLVPLRKQTYKNIEILSKFGAGEASGGEFFDTVAHDAHVAYIHYSTNSYVLNSKILTSYELWKPSFNGQESSLEQLLTMICLDAVSFINKTQKDHRPALEVCLLMVNNKTLEVSGWVFGSFQLISSEGFVVDSREIPVIKEFSDKAKIKFKLERSGRMLILSPGVKSNSGGFINKIPTLSFVKDWIGQSATKCINEIFYHLRKGDNESFFRYDLTTTVIEVSGNAIVKV